MRRFAKEKFKEFLSDGSGRGHHDAPDSEDEDHQQHVVGSRHHGAPESSKLCRAPSRFQPPVPVRRKKALLIGINYTGTKAALNGCVNDVKAMYKFLRNHGFPEDGILLLTDDRNFSHKAPTKNEILKGMHWLASDSRPGDSLFFHFSGHGSQQPDKSGREEDGLNETILPIDFERSGMIADDEIAEYLVNKLHDGARLTAIMDSCHSGSGMDLPYTLDHGHWKRDWNPYYSLGDVLCYSAAQDNQTAADQAYQSQQSMGALTSVWLECVNSAPSHEKLLEMCRRKCVGRKLQQIPQLNASQRTSKRFSSPGALFDHEIQSNTNKHYGIHHEKTFKPSKPGLPSGPLGELLQAAGFSFFASQMISTVAPVLIQKGFDLFF